MYVRKHYKLVITNMEVIGLKNTKTGIRISIFGIIISLVLIAFLLFTEKSIWFGIVILLSNITIYLSNIAKYKVINKIKK